MPCLHPHRSFSFRKASAASTQLLVFGLIALLVLPPSAPAQASGMNVQVNAPLTFHITILEGDNALNNIRQRTAREPIVQIEDSNHKPVAGVAVLFTSVRGPTGAGGSFNSFTSYKTVTNAEGKATGRGFQPNTTTGQFTIDVQAGLGSMMVGVVIHEENTLIGSGGGGGSTQLPDSATKPAQVDAASSGPGHVLHLINLIPKWALVGAAVGGASIAAVMITRNSSGAVIASGGGTVTAPARR